MSLSRVGSGGAGTYSTTGTSYNIPYPTGISAGDLLVMEVWLKPGGASAGTMTTPSGWTLEGTFRSETGTQAVDTGDTRVYFFTKVATGSESGNQVVVGDTVNTWLGDIVAIRSSTGATMTTGFCSGEKTAAGTPAAITMSSNPGITAGDFLLAIFMSCTDAGTSTGYSAPSISATSATIGTPTQTRQTADVGGTDSTSYGVYATCSAGTASAAPAFGFTIGGTTTNQKGAAAILRVREVSSDITATGGLTAGTAAVLTPTLAVDVARAPSLIAGTSAVLAPTLPADVTVTPGLIVCTAQVTGGVSVLADVTVAPLHLAGVAEVFTADAVVSDDVTATAELVVGTSAVLAPAALGIDVTIVAPLVDAHAHIDQVTLNATVTVIPALVAGTAAVLAPTVSADFVVAPSLISDPHAHVEPVTVVWESVASPALITGSAAVLAPTLASDVTVDPALIVGVAVVPSAAATSDADASVSPGLIVGTSTVLAGTPLSDVVVNPALISGTSAILSATVLSGLDVSVTPTLVVGTGALYPVTVVGEVDATATTTLVTGTASVYTATALTSADVTVTPTLLVGGAQVYVPTPISVVAVTVHPATVAGTASVYVATCPLFKFIPPPPPGAGFTYVALRGWTRSTASVVTNALAPGQIQRGTIDLASGWRIYRVQVNRPCRIRLYVSEETADADLNRNVGTYPDTTTDHGLFFEFAAGPSLLEAVLSPQVDGYCPIGVAVPYSITNHDGSVGPVSVALTYVRTE